MSFKKYFDANSITTIYRAVPFNAPDIFRVDDYVTKSLKFALEHAETSAIYNGEDYKVIRANIDGSAIKDASNPGEYLMVKDVPGKISHKLVLNPEYQTVETIKV